MASDNAESNQRQERAGMPFAMTTRGYPVLGISLQPVSPRGRTEAERHRSRQISSWRKAPLAPGGS